ncbi:MAG: 50S ribosomal protein L25 [Acidobacteriota bacterium]|nr:50S ribosomal protein L25 [Acidobacteriota bacterium]
MRKDITVAAEVRTSRGKNEARRTRRAGQIPAVVYGAFQDPVSIAVNPKDISKIIRSASGLNTIFNLAIAGGENTPVMVVDEQVDPIKGNLLHADFKRIDLTKRIKVTVPVHTEGEAVGVKVQGGLLEIISRSIEIECLPDEIPEGFTVSVSDLNIGQSRRAGEVALTGSMKLVGDAQTVIAHIVTLRREATETPAEGAAAAPAEPEVVKKGKKEEEGAAADKDKDKAKKK